MPYRNLEDKIEHNRAYAEKNRDAIRQRKREWYRANKDRLMKKQQEKRFEEKMDENLERIVANIELTN